MYSLVLLAETEPEKATAPATISAMPVSTRVIFEKKPLENNSFREEPDKAKRASSKALIAQIAKLTFKIQIDVVNQVECAILFKSMSVITHLCLTLISEKSLT